MALRMAANMVRTPFVRGDADDGRQAGSSRRRLPGTTHQAGRLAQGAASGTVASQAKRSG